MSARIIAVWVLSRILKSQETLPLAFKQQHISDGFQKLSQKDKGFCYNLVMMSLRHYDELESFLKTLPDKKMRFKPYDKVPLLLITGLVQIIFFKTPLYAVQAESKKLLRRPEDAAFKKFIHAILQRGFERQEELGGKEISAWQEGWRQHYGEEIAQGMWQAIYEKPPLDLHFIDEKSCQTFVQKLDDKKILHQQGAHLRIAGDDIVEKLPFYDKGMWWVQDIAATIPVQILLEQQMRGQRVLDLCAAPGGKTIQLINGGAKVTAVDKSASKIKILQQNLKRMQMQCDIVTEDVMKYQNKDKFALILLDAPCSASGTMRHNPELPLIKTHQESASIAEVQFQLLNHAYENLLSDGGRMVYSVCSLETCEGEELIKRLTDIHKSAKIIPPVKFSEFCHIGNDGTLRTYPSDWQDKGRMDGFFIACIGK